MDGKILGDVCYCAVLSTSKTARPGSYGFHIGDAVLRRSWKFFICVPNVQQFIYLKDCIYLLVLRSTNFWCCTAETAAPITTGLLPNKHEYIYLEPWPSKNKTEHVQPSKPWAEIIIQQDRYSMEWNFIFYNLGIWHHIVHY